jgi:hypothetical protein
MLDQEDEEDSDCEIIGYFDSVASAMANIIEAVSRKLCK